MRKQSDRKSGWSKAGAIAAGLCLMLGTNGTLADSGASKSEDAIRTALARYDEALRSGNGELTYLSYSKEYADRLPDSFKAEVRKPKTRRPSFRREISSITVREGTAIVCGTISGIELGDIDPATGHAPSTNQFRQIMVTEAGTWTFSRMVETPPAGPCDSVLGFTVSAGWARETNARSCERPCCCRVSETDPRFTGFMTRRFCDDEAWCRQYDGTCVDKSECVVVDLECIDPCCCEQTQSGGATQRVCTKEEDCVGHGGRCLEAARCRQEGMPHSEAVPPPLAR